MHKRPGRLRHGLILVSFVYGHVDFHGKWNYGGISD